MKNIGARRALSIGICTALMLSSLLFVPTSGAPEPPREWKEWSYDDFSDSLNYAPYTYNIVLNGMAGGDGYITLKRNHTWYNMESDSNPGRRDGFGFAFDGKYKVGVLFGGYDDGVDRFMNDLWEYDYETNTWTEIIPCGAAGSPPRRTNCKMDYDSANNMIVLWGGYGELPPYIYSDTWEYDVDKKTWTEIHPNPSPPAIEGYALAYDSKYSKIIMTGSNESRDDSNATLHLWAYDAGTDTWTERTSTPYPRTGHDMAFNGDVMVLQGGDWGADDEIKYGDTLEYNYDTDSWTRYGSSPGYRTGNAMARYGNGVWDVCGKDKFGYLNDLWNYTGDGHWEDKSPWQEAPDPKPSWIHNHRMVFDSYHKVLILYGGYGYGDEPYSTKYSNDTWIYTYGYKAMGWYVSNCSENAPGDTFFFDSGSLYTNWLRIWWNDSVLPPGTKLKFQLQSGNGSHPGEDIDQTLFVGPGNSTKTYYETPGQIITDEHKYHRYIRYKVILRGSPSHTPVFDDITITYRVERLPFIMSTEPDNQEIDVPLWENITVVFSERMYTGSDPARKLTWTIDPDPCPGSWIIKWSSTHKTNDTVTFEHPVAFIENEKYTVNITHVEGLDGMDFGDPYQLSPWTFTTTPIKPWLVDTYPAHGEINVPLDENIILNFSEPMDNETVNWIITSNPVPAPSLTHKWANGNTTLYLYHTEPFTEGQSYLVSITGKDLEGNSMDYDRGAPNPWRFYAYTDDPFVADRDPEHGTFGIAIDKNIIITFSEEMNPATVTYNVTTTGYDGPHIDLGWTEVWEKGNTVLNISHSTLFNDGIRYFVNVTSGEDLIGNPLNRSVGLPQWWFFSEIVAPWIVSTEPFDGELGVATVRDIIIEFSVPMNKSNIEWIIDPWIIFTKSWNTEGTVLTLTHSKQFLGSMTYIVEITHAEDLDGHSLDSSQGAPNPWWFATRPGRPCNLRIERSPPNDLLIDWDPVPGEIDGYYVYVSNDRFASWPSGWNKYDWPMPPPARHDGVLTDGLNYFYIVRAYKSSDEGGNSTMGVKAHLEFDPPLDQSQFDIYWLSLPYNSIYDDATDIVKDIEGGLGKPSKIRFVAKWDRDEQRTKFFYYSQGKWWGEPFDIYPGDGIAIGGIQQNFAWYINGTDISYELPFRQGRYDWISLPYTGIYASASDIIMDIEGGLGSPTKINEIGKWNAKEQKWEVYRWNGVTWTGDFTINVGEGIYLHSISDFDWTPKLLTPAIT